MSKKAGLGKGLGAIFGENPTPMPVEKPEATEVVEGTPQEVVVKHIVPNPYQPRQIFDEEKLQELAASIKEHGIVQPLVVRKKGRRYELVAGERRWRAAQMVGLINVPVIIRKYKDREMMEIALIENIQRHDLNPIEEAQGLRRLMTECKLTQEQAAEKIGRSRTAVTNILRILNLHEDVQAYIVSGELTMGQAKQLLMLPKMEQQLEVANAIIANGWSARMTEDVVNELRAGRQVKVAREVVKSIVPPTQEEKQDKKIKIKVQKPTEEEVFYRDFESRMVELLGTKVKVKQNQVKEGGTIEIEYYSAEDLERIYEALQQKPEPTVKAIPRKLHV